MSTCPNFPANACAGPPSGDGPGCPGQTDIAACRYLQALQAFEGETPDQQEAASGFALVTNPDGFPQFSDGATANVDPPSIQPTPGAAGPPATVTPVSATP